MMIGVRPQLHAQGDGLLPQGQYGFTIVELMVVVLVIGILIAIAIPTFLGSRNRAFNRAAQSDLRNALVAAKSSYATRADYTCALYLATVPCPQALPQLEPSLTYVAAATLSTTALPRVSVTAATQTIWAAARMSRSGTCFAIRDVQTGNPPTLVGTWYGQTLAAANCRGSSVTAAAAPNKAWT
jgi:type IV pilus assembly protein PilA